MTMRLGKEAEILFIFQSVISIYSFQSSFTQFKKSVMFVIVFSLQRKRPAKYNFLYFDSSLNVLIPFSQNTMRSLQSKMPVFLISVSGVNLESPILLVIFIILIFPSGISSPHEHIQFNKWIEQHELPIVFHHSHRTLQREQITPQ